jgi:hypothetical protein
MDTRKQLLDAFVRKSTTYTIEVRKSEMLPAELIERKEIDFKIKPPTTYVLSLCASLMEDIPDEVYNTENADLKTAMTYQDQIARIISVLSWEDSDYPEWYVEFILKNVQIVDLLKIMQETALKCNPSFFLSCFQIAKVSNPMNLNDSIPTAS